MTYNEIKPSQRVCRHNILLSDVKIILHYHVCNTRVQQTLELL